MWLNLRYALCAGELFDPERLKAAGLDEPAIEAALARLEEYGLVVRDGDGFIVNEPLSREAFAARFGDEAAREAGGERRALAAAPYGGLERPSRLQESGNGAALDAAPGAASVPGTAEPAKGEAEPQPVLRSPLSKRRRTSRMLRLVEPAAQPAGPENPDMQAVVQIYHKRIGMIGPTQYEKLRFWVEEQGMEGAVVALAIEETVRSADVPRISYLEGILRNWYNDGIRTLADVHAKQAGFAECSRAIDGRAKSDRPRGDAERFGVPERQSAELVAKWKELYPDEYDALSRSDMASVVPADIDAERRVLGILIKHPHLIDTVVDRLTPEHFFEPRAPRDFPGDLRPLHQGRAHLVHPGVQPAAQREGARRRPTGADPA